jgi:ribosomal RNA-processing protein 36
MKNKMKKSDVAIASSSKIKFDDSDDQSSSDEEEEIKRQLADVTFEDLQKARSSGSQAIYEKLHVVKKTSRANKNRPMEVSSKKPVSRYREVFQVPKKVARDPRFESLCGEFNADGFRKRYNFLYENKLPAEKEELKNVLKKSNDPEVVDDLKRRLSWIDKQLKSSAVKNNDKEILTEHKKKEREAAKQGKQPYYLKKSDIRKQKLIEKYKELKSSGKLESFIEKRRRKNAAKDHKFVPYRRPINNKE